jgi:hypothetical protein
MKRVLISLIFLIAACGTGLTSEPQSTVESQDPEAPEAVPDAQQDASAPAPDASSAPDAPAKKDANGSAADVGTCFDQLNARAIGYKKTSARGLVDAVTLTDPAINGVKFAANTTTKPLADPIACEFVLTLYDFAAILKKYGIVSVGSLGSYCYRCCCAWSKTNYCRGLNDPEPDCSENGYSNHSWGRAIDIRYIKFADGKSADINSNADWVQATNPTCGTALAAQSGMSKTLYSIVCDAAAAKIFTTSLTPNYNAGHRSHWHLDTGVSGPVGGQFTKSRNDELPLSRLGEVDVGGPSGVCGDE